MSYWYKKIKTFFLRLFCGLSFVVVLSFVFLYFIDKRMTILLKPYVHTEVERFTNNIVVDVIHQKMKNAKYHDFFKEEEGKISYDTVKIDVILEEITQDVQEVLMNLDDGKVEEKFLSNRIKKGRFQKIKKGILCDVSFGSIRNSSLFANVGPTIPIKLLFIGQVHSDIDVQVKEYGINNVLVEIYLVITIKEQITMPITSTREEIIVREPIAIDIIKGEVPDYYGGFSK